MNLEAMLEPANSSDNVTKIQPPYWYYFLFVMGSSNHFYSGVLISGTQVPIFRGSVLGARVLNSTGTQWQVQHGTL